MIQMCNPAVDMHTSHSESAAGALGNVNYCAVTISALMVAGIVALMIRSHGKGEDIAGIVARHRWSRLSRASSPPFYKERVRKAMNGAPSSR